MWYIYTMEYYSAIKKKEIMPFAATCMQLEIVILSEVSQRKTNTIWPHLYVESKIWHNLSMKQKQTHRHTEKTCDCQGGVGAVREVWIGSLGLADAKYFI